MKKQMKKKKLNGIKADVTRSKFGKNKIKINISEIDRYIDALQKRIEEMRIVKKYLNS